MNKATRRIEPREYIIEDIEENITSDILLAQGTKVDIKYKVAELRFEEVASLLSLARDEAILVAGNSTRDRKRGSWRRFYSARMLRHSHSDGEFPIYRQGKLVLYPVP